MFWNDTEARRYLEENGLPHDPRSHVLKKMTMAASFLKGSAVLDVGCGEGHLYPFIKDKVEKYVGLDASSDMIKVAKSFSPEASWMLGNVYDLEEVDMTDTVYSISLLIHLKDQEEAIRQLWSRAIQRLVFLIPIQSEDEVIDVRPGLIYHQTTFDRLKAIIESLKGFKQYSIRPLSDLRPRIKFKLGLLPSTVRLHYFVVIDRDQQTSQEMKS